MKKENLVAKFVRRHKAGIIIAGVSVAVVCGVVLLNKNGDEIKRFMLKKEHSKRLSTRGTSNEYAILETIEVIEVMPESETIIDVPKHLRGLPNGHHTSLEKKIEAMENGIELPENKTLVSAYSRRSAA